MNDRLLRISLAAALLAVLAGCGNKGPLMHPTAPADELATPASTAPAAPTDATMPVPASTAPAAPTDVTAPAPASTVPATPVEPTPVPPPDGGG